MSRPGAAIAAIVATLWLLAGPGHALADQAAVDEYSQAPAGSQNVAREDVQKEPGAGRQRDPQALGVVGEGAAAQSPVEAAASSMGPAVPWLVAFAIAALLALVLVRRSRRSAR